MSLIFEDTPIIITNESFKRTIVNDIILEEEFIINNMLFYSYSRNGIMHPYSFYTKDYFMEMSLEGLLSEDDLENMVETLEDLNIKIKKRKKG